MKIWSGSTKHPPCPKEDVEQTLLVRWASHHWLGEHLFAIPNGGLRNKRVATLLKAQGVKPGVSDLMLAVPSQDKHGLFVEMKRTKGSKISKEQQKFIDARLLYGYEAKVAYGWKHAVEIITEYLGGSLDAF